MPHDECKDIKGFEEVGAALGEIVDPRLSKIASKQGGGVWPSQATRAQVSKLSSSCREG